MTEQITMQEPAEATQSAFPMPVEIQQALEHVGEIQGKLASIRAMIHKTEGERVRADEERERSFSALADVEADALLNGSASQSESLRRVVQRHEQALLIQNARLTGLRTREREARVDLEQAMLDLEQARQTWAAAEAENARRDFEVALDNFIAAAARPIATGLALSDATLSLIARTSNIPCPANVGANAMGIFHHWRSTSTVSNLVRDCAFINAEVGEALAAAREVVSSK